ncbi:MAG: glutamate--tRNA ligase [Candidatus Margulisbacteria bacterium]|nr:glutamate--tRNA ligase [Candidatus Margulisiibacteriota bacterium]
MIITRFAPSPTGNLHIGGARTALFNYLYAKHCKGKFLLRFEDTDVERSKEEYATQIKKSLKWIGINWDNEEVPYQSKRLQVYASYKDHLIEKGLAYKKDGAIYLKGKDNVEDFVIWRSDGMPIFHFTVVIDDHDMHVNCIIRGVDHLTNTEKHKIIYDYLDFPKPEWHHIPLIVDENSKPLSKRRDDASVTFYQEKEYLPEAVMNYLARLGWGHENQEIFSEKELVELFDVNKVSKNPAKIDFKKLNWLNSQYISNADASMFKKYQQYSNIQKSIDNAERSDLYKELMKKVQIKAFSVQELNELLHPFVNDFLAGEELLKEHQVFILSLLPQIKKVLENIPQEKWTESELDEKLSQLMTLNQITFKDIAMPLRELITGQKKSLGIGEILFYLGRKTALSRLQIL